jgi:tetratricopeptide (TPR) repeat protein
MTTGSRGTRCRSVHAQRGGGARTRRASTLLSLVLTLSALSLSSPAKGDEPPASESAAIVLSEQRAAEAYEAYSKKDYATAVALYLQAYEAAPNGSILYNIARIYDTKLVDRHLAIRFYRRYVADPGTYTERVEWANQRIQQLREAENVAKRASEDPVPSGAGAGVDPGDREPRGRGDEQPRKRAESGWSALRSTGAVASAVGVAALSVGVAFALSAMSNADTAHELCDGNACTSQRGVDAAKSADSAASISNIGFAAGGGLLAAGVVLFLLGGDESSEGSRTGKLHWTPRASSSAATLEVSGRW